MVAEPAAKDLGRGRRPIAIVLAVMATAAVLYAGAVVDLPITTKGEAREAVVVQAMVRDAQYVLPMRNGDEIPSKPPLFHWLAAAASRLTGEVTPTTVRTVSLVSSLFMLALTTLYAHRAWGRRAAIATGIVLLSMQQVMASATAARVDMLLAACVAAATFSGARAIAQGVPLPTAFFVAISLAVLAKGPVGYVLPIASVLVYGVAMRKRPSLSGLNLRIALPVLALPLLWYGAAWAAGGERFVDTLLLKENYYRIVDPDAVSAGHVRPAWYYLPALLGATAPWCVLLVPALCGAWVRRGRLKEEETLLPLVWILTTVALFSLAGSKRSVYLLPCFPAVALLVGHWVGTRQRAADSSRPIAFAAATAGYAAASLLALMIVLIAAQALGVPTFSWIEPLIGGDADRANLAALAQAASAQRARLIGWAGAALALIGLAIAYGRAGRLWALFQSVAMFVLLTVPIAGLPMYRAMMQRQSVEGFVAAMRELVPDDEPLHFYEGVDYAVTFYMKRPVPRADTVASITGRNRAWFFVWESSIDGLCEGLAKLDPPGMRADCRVEARFDYNGNPRSRALALVEVRRRGEGRTRKTIRPHGRT